MEHRKSAPASPSCTPDVTVEPVHPLEPVPWLPVLETGDAEIDEDHRRATEGGNRIRRMINERAPWPDFVAEMRQACDRCAQHFETEDRVLKAKRFPGADAHRRAHRRILAEFNGIMAELESVTVPEDRHWVLAKTPLALLLDHCLRDDLKFKSHLMHYEPPRK